MARSVVIKMKQAMDKQTLREWQADYEQFHHFEIEEKRRASFSDRLKALNKILEFARQMQLRPRDDDSESEEVYRRWQRIRERYGKAD